jgi:hypothetical protein
MVWYGQCCFSKKNIYSGMQNLVGWGEGGVSYTDTRKKVLERCFILQPSEKELPEWRSSAFRHKNIPGTD